MVSNTNLLILITAFILPFLTWAEDVIDLGTFVRTASRTPIPIDQVGSSVTVIDRTQIENRQAVFLSDLLRDVPGVAVNRSGGFGSFTQVRIRGGEANQTLVIIDGIEANDPATGSEFDFAHLLTSDIDRIEVIRGPQSSLWGSDALAGVINITTRKGSGGLKVDGYAFGGSFSTVEGGAGVSYGNDLVNFMLRSTKFDSQGNNVAERGGEQDSYRNETWNFDFGLSPIDEIEFTISGRHTKGKREFDPTGLISRPIDGDRSTEVNQSYGRAQVKFKLFDGKWQHIFGTAITHGDNDNFNRGVEETSNQGKKFKLDYQTNIAIEIPFLANARHTLSLIVEREREDFDQRGPITVFGDPNQDQDITNKGYIGEYRMELWNRVFLSASLRKDDNDRFDNTTTQRFTAAYTHLESGTKIRGSYGKGVKNPTFTDLFGFFPRLGNGNQNFFGNPNLEPERSEGWEVGLDQQFSEGRVDLSATYFREKLKDEINGFFFDPTIGMFTAINVDGESIREGFEISFTAEVVEALDITANYSYIDATQPNGLGKQVREIRRPEKIASFNANYRFWDDRANLNLGINYTGHQYDNNFSTFPATRVRLDDYLLVNLAASFTVNSNVTIVARAENLFDEQYQDVFGFETPGMGLYAGAKVNF